MKDFDDIGRCIPGQLTAQVHTQVRRYFKCDQPELDLDAIYARISQHLGACDSLSAADFKTRVAGILEKLETDSTNSNLLRGVYVPFFLPQASAADVGTALEESYLPALERAFEEKFPDYSFSNHVQRSLASRLKVAPGSRHDKLLDRLEQEPLVGIYFPAMDAYSLPAARERMAGLTDELSLAGGVDTCAAMIGCPELLLRRDGYPPLLWFGALESEDQNEGFHLEAYGYNLTFNRRPHLDQAAEYWANGLVILG